MARATRGARAAESEAWAARFWSGRASDEVAHQGAAGEHEVGRGGGGGRERGVFGRPGVAEFQHVAEDGDAAGCGLQGENGQGGAHGGAVAVVALVEQEGGAARNDDGAAGAAAGDGGEGLQSGEDRLPPVMAGL